jgi:hypothetical protein
VWKYEAFEEVLKGPAKDCVKTSLLSNGSEQAVKIEKRQGGQYLQV